MCVKKGTAYEAYVVDAPCPQKSSEVAILQVSRVEITTTWRCRRPEAVAFKKKTRYRQ